MVFLGYELTDAMEQVVSTMSILQLLDGQPVTDANDEKAMRNYLLRCLEGQDGLQMCP